MLVYPALLGGGLVFVGLTGEPGGGVWLAGELLGARTRTYSFALETRFLFPSRVIEEATKKPFEVSTVMVAMVPCARWYGLLGCAVVDMSAFIAGNGLPSTVYPLSIGVGVGPRLAAQIPLSEAKLIGLRIFADLRFALGRTPLADNHADAKEYDFKSEVISGLFGVALTYNAD
jgi:hypothetical protein